MLVRSEVNEGDLGRDLLSATAHGPEAPMADPSHAPSHHAPPTHADASPEGGRLVVAHERLVEARRVGRVVELPAGAAVVAEAGKVSTEVRTGVPPAHVARRLLEVRVDLDLNITQGSIWI